MKIGILGKTGSGKSTVASYLKKSGYTIIDLDQLAKELPIKHPQILVEISETFGQNYIKESKIDRKKLGKLVFSSEKELNKLNNIFFAYIRKEVKKITSKIKNVVIEGVIIFEAKLDKYLDKTIYVYCGEISKTLERLKEREDTSLELLKERLHIQQKYEKYIARVDYKIDNSQPVEVLYKKIENIKKTWIFEK